jgi:5'-nucleotidase
LAEAVAPLGEVWVVAPESEQSAASHAISLHRPLRIRQVKERWFAVDGTPTDCVYLALHHVMKNERPGLCLSGINHGPNLADDVTYSGTVAAAMEAYTFNVPSMAFSLATRRQFDFTHAARFAYEWVKGALAQPLPERMLLNVNLPPGELNGYRVTVLGRRSYGNEVVEALDPRGRKYYWIGGAEYQHQNVPGSDCNTVIDEKLVSITPMHMDLTSRAGLETLSRWPVSGFKQVPARSDP